MKQELQGQAAWIYRTVLSHPLLPAFLKEQQGGGSGHGVVNACAHEWFRTSGVLRGH